MPIISVRGDIFAAHVEALTNPVNCVGVMGKGLALEFKRRYPTNFAAYARACTSGVLRPGQPVIFDPGVDMLPRYIVNSPTKRHWRDPSRLDDIEAGLATLVSQIERLSIGSIAILPLGCGLGGLDWASQGRTACASRLCAYPTGCGTSVSAIAVFLHLKEITYVRNYATSTRW